MKRKIIKNNKFSFSMIKSQGGFTLVEALFAVLILTFTVTGLMTIVANSLFSARYSKDEITVNYLMQEVIDSIRNDRDATVFLDEKWEDFRTNYQTCLITQFNTNGCYFNVLDKGSDKIKACTSSGCPFMFYDKNANSGSFYNYDESYTRTNFIRKIVVEESSENRDELIFTVTVTWKNGSLSVSRSLSTSLTNWR
jgi:Tfp pilus assembly protein PilV